MRTPKPTKVMRWRQQVAVRLADRQIRDLRALARRRQQPVSELLRSAVESLLAGAQATA
jgi:hypothetical protein